MSKFIEVKNANDVVYVNLDQVVAVSNNGGLLKLTMSNGAIYYCDVSFHEFAESLEKFSLASSEE